MRRARQVQSVGIIESHNMKNTIDIRWVVNPKRQRLATSRKRALRSRTVRPARSVCSEHQSRVMESRNKTNRCGLLYRIEVGRIDLYTVRLPVKGMQAKYKWAQPGAKSRAEVYLDILGTWEDLSFLDVKMSRTGVAPGEQVNSIVLRRTL